MALRASARSSHKVATPSCPRRCAAPVTRNPTISPMSSKANPPGREAGGGPVECMGHIGDPERGRDPAAPSPLRLPRPWTGRRGSATTGRRLRGSGLVPAALRERRGLALHAHQQPGPRRLRAPAHDGPAPAGDQLLAALTDSAGLRGRERARAQRTGQRLHRSGADTGVSTSVGPRTCPARPKCWGRCSRAGTPWCASTTPSLPTRSSSTCPRACAVDAPVAHRALVRQRVRLPAHERARREESTCPSSRCSPVPRAPTGASSCR